MLSLSAHQHNRVAAALALLSRTSRLARADPVWGGKRRDRKPTVERHNQTEIRDRDPCRTGGRPIPLPAKVVSRFPGYGSPLP